MIALSQIPYSVAHGQIIPHYLSPKDVTWIRCLLDEYLRFVDRPKKELLQRLREPLPAHVPKRQSRVVIRLLDRLFLSKLDAPFSPRKIRSVVFVTAAERGSEATRYTQLKEAAQKLGLTVEETLESLYADIPEEKKLKPPQVLPAPAELLEQANLLLAQGIVARSRNLRVELYSSVRPTIRAARMLGLLCEVETQQTTTSIGSTYQDTSALGQTNRRETHTCGSGKFYERNKPKLTPCRKPSKEVSNGCRVSTIPLLQHGARTTRINVSGPLSLFHQTMKYSEALSRLLPVLARCPKWKVEAECIIKKRSLTFNISHADRILPMNLEANNNRFDSMVEKHFYEDFIKTAPAWEILREPEPVYAESTLIFPDFALSHRDLPHKRVLMEIIGFWTPEYLKKKLTLIQKANLHEMIICVSKSLACGEKELPPKAEIIRYGKKVSAKKVLQAAQKILFNTGAH